MLSRLRLFASFIFVIVSMISICGCSKILKLFERDEPYKLLHEKSEIIEISIVNIIDLEAENLEMLTVISDIEAFLTDLNKIKFGRYIIGDPVRLNHGYAIKITYKNGDYEYINDYAQQIVTEGQMHFGQYNCDKNEFNSLLKLYGIDC